MCCHKNRTRTGCGYSRRAPRAVIPDDKSLLLNPSTPAGLLAPAPTTVGYTTFDGKADLTRPPPTYSVAMGKEAPPSTPTPSLQGDHSSYTVVENENVQRLIATPGATCDHEPVTITEGSASFWPWARNTTKVVCRKCGATMQGREYTRSKGCRHKNKTVGKSVYV